jgi:hypothetical protein
MINEKYINSSAMKEKQRISTLVSLMTEEQKEKYFNPSASIGQKDKILHEVDEYRAMK